jgi:hypothetical protein
MMHMTWLLALSILAMLLSTSTTGLLTLAVGLPLIMVLTAARADRQALARLGKTGGMLMLGGLIALTPVVIMKPALLDAVSGVVDNTLTKGDSDSYADRTATDVAALDTVSTTYGLGVGWGSFRSSSLVPGLLANAGVFGLVAVLWLGLRTTQLVRRRTAAMRDHPGCLVVGGFSAALCGQLTAALFSAPTIASLAFFLQLGCVIGVSARMSIEAGLLKSSSVGRPGSPRTGGATVTPVTAQGSFVG